MSAGAALVVLIEAVALFAGAMSVAAERSSLDGVFEKIWLKFPPRIVENPKEGEISLSVLHARLLKRRANQADIDKQNVILTELNKQGYGNDPREVLRVTCRQRICETLFANKYRQTSFTTPGKEQTIALSLLRTCHSLATVT